MKEQKKWYDYLWIVELTYLCLGFFNILFAWLGLIFFFVPLIISLVKGTKSYCNRYCGRGQVFALLGGRFGLSRKKDIPNWMKSKAFRYGFPVRLSDLFLHHVFPDVMEHLSCVCGYTESETGRDPAVDLQTALALGLSRHSVSSRCCPVCLWLLQRDADINSSGTLHYDSVQTEKLVRLLSHGNHDPADL